MKIRRLYLSVLFFLIFLLSFSFSSAKVYAIGEDLSATPSSQQVEYQLPYPGLLPDSPLYFLRVIRDRVIGFLISDPLIKAEFDLLQADKRLNAGIYLFNKGKVSLAVETISKAENYFEEAIGKVEQAKTEGRNVDEMTGKLKSALRKHQQELDNLVQKADKNSKAGFAKEQKRVMDFDKLLN